jgi:hypothetical protein
MMRRRRMRMSVAVSVMMMMMVGAWARECPPSNAASAIQPPNAIKATLYTRSTIAPNRSAAPRQPYREADQQGPNDMPETGPRGCPPVSRRDQLCCRASSAVGSH